MLKSKKINIKMGWTSKKKQVEAPDDKCFWLLSGERLHNFSDLVNALKGMSDDTFRFHVNSERNDFARWIEDVLGDAQIAKAIKSIKTPKGFLKKLESNLKECYK